jgi:hypothetical protein
MPWHVILAVQLVLTNDAMPVMTCMTPLDMPTALGNARILQRGDNEMQ